MTHYEPELLDAMIKHGETHTEDSLWWVKTVPQYGKLLIERRLQQHQTEITEQNNSWRVSGC